MATLLRRPRRPRLTTRALQRTVSTLALVAGSLGLAAVADPASAQCVEGPPNSYTCSGEQTSTQGLAGPTLSVVTTPGFAVDTTSNGGGPSILAWGTGSVSYVDQHGSRLAGGGAYYRTLTGNLNVISNGVIDADAAGDGLLVESLGIGDVNLFWTADIENSGGVGARVVGSGDIFIQVASISAREDSLVVTQAGPGRVTLIATGDISSAEGRGIQIDSGADVGDMFVDVRSVSGEDGIMVYNGGTGSTVVRAESVTATHPFGEGVRVFTGFFSSGVFVEVGDVSGGSYGVNVVSSGSQGTVVRTGDVVATGTGVSVVNDDLATDLTLTTGSVSGGLRGIDVVNFGVGDTLVSAEGTISSADGEGVFVYNETDAGALRLEVLDVTGTTGVRVNNRGSGATLVLAGGPIVGTEQFGVEAFNDAGASDLSLVLGAVHGASGGVFARNFGTGETFVSTQGDVIGDDGDGVSVDIGFSAGDVAVQTARTVGRNNGVSIGNSGLGSTQLVLSGDAVGELEDGVYVFNGAQTTGLGVFGRNARGAGYGVFGQNFGSGDTTMFFSGQLVGETRDGLRVLHAGGAGALTLDLVSVRGGEAGVVARNEGGGAVDLTLRGLIEGGALGVEVYADPTNDASITNLGTVRRVSGDSSADVLSASGRRVDLTNSGAITGSVEVTADSSLFLNEGGWNASGGVSFFSGADDRIFNAGSGLILGADDATLQESTAWSGLEQLDSAGTISLADGASGDTLRMDADVRFQDGSVLAADIGGASGSDLFQTLGSVDIEASSGLAINVAHDLTLHERYVVVEAAAGLTGEFDFEDVFLTAFAGLRDGYTATTAFVEFAQLRALADAAITPNQKEAAAGADSLPDGNAVKDALLLLAEDAAAIAAFDQLSGEIHPSTRTAAIEDSRLPRNAVLDRLADREPDAGFWVQVHGDAGVSDGDFNAARVERHSRGLVFGVDRTFGPVTLGVAGGWSETDVEIARRDSESSIESLYGLIYAATRVGGWGVRGGAGYARNSTETERRIDFPGFSGTPTADYDGAVMQAFVEAGYRAPLGGGHVEPFVNLTAVRAENDAFSELDGPAALNVEETSQTSTISTLGLRFETNRSGAIALRGDVGWRHSFGDLRPVNQHAFDGGAPFTILGAAQSEDAAVARVEARWQMSPRVSFGLAYDGVLGTDGEDHAITGGVKVVF